ncbi:MAG TPA: amidohydrolase family protein [Myxococcota bacterium]|nr:amidohydrolase family protein [Myxococcota bacterium]
MRPRPPSFLPSRPRRRMLSAVTALAALAGVAACVAGCRSDAPDPAGPTASSAAAEPAWHLGRPVIDSHVHLSPNMQALARALEVFDRVGIDRFVVKSAGSVGSPRYQATLAMQRVLGDRMRAFANIDWQGIDDPRWTQRQVAALERAKADGILGVKVFKALGLGVRTADGKLLSIDDPRLDAIFDACGRLGLIFAWHVADPRAFFQPVTPDNERYDELKIAEDWSFHGKDFPSFDELMAAQERRIRKHPGTTFLLIHLGNDAEDLDNVDHLLTTYPNVFVDTSARVPEFGRHPADRVRAFFVKHQDRILFGSDFIVDFDGRMQLGSVWHVPDQQPGVDDAVEFFVRHWRYFETDGKQIDHPTPIQGRWKVDAIALPPDVLHKLYVANAERLLFGPPAADTNRNNP